MAWTSPRTWVAGETVTAAIMNVHVRDNLKAIGDPWTAYTPTLGNWTLGDGTLTGAHMTAGKLVHFRINYTIGSTDAISGAPTFSPPVGIASGFGASSACGPAYLFDTSATARRYWSTVVNSSTSFLIRNPDGANTSATVPWTWAAGDQMTLTGSYEAV